MVSRWFGVVGDDEMTTAGRAGTLPRSEAVRNYTIIGPHQEPEPVGMELANGRNESEIEQTAANWRDRRRSRLQRVTATLTLQRRRQWATSRDEVQKSLPKFWPVATVLVALAELALLVALLALNGFAPISFTPRIIPGIIEGFGNTSEYVSREEVPNFFIGPSSSSLIHAGAKYTPVSEVQCVYQQQSLLCMCHYFIVLNHTPFAMKGISRHVVYTMDYLGSAF